MRWETTISLERWQAIATNLFKCLFNKLSLDLEKVMSSKELSDITRDYVRQNIEDMMRATHDIWYLTQRYDAAHFEHATYWTSLATYINTCRVRSWEPYNKLNVSGEMRALLKWYALYVCDTVLDLERRATEVRI